MRCPVRRPSLTVAATAVTASALFAAALAGTGHWPRHTAAYDCQALKGRP